MVQRVGRSTATGGQMKKVTWSRKLVHPTDRKFVWELAQQGTKVFISGKVAHWSGTKPSKLN